MSFLVGVFIVVVMSGMVYASWMTTTDYRLKHGRVLSTLNDTPNGTVNVLGDGCPCFVCGRLDVNLVLRNRWQQDLPVCDVCVRESAPPEASQREVRTQKRRGLDEVSPPGAPEPKF